MKKMFRRGIALLVCVISLYCFGCGKKAPEAATPAPTGTPVLMHSYSHEDITLSNMVYARPDMELIAARLDDLLRGISIGKPVAEMIEEYEQIRTLINEADSMSSLAYLYYAFDVTEDYYQNEYSYLQTAMSDIDLMMTDASIALFESSEEAEDAAREAFGEEYVDTVYEEEHLNNDAISALEEAELALVNQYDRLQSTYTVLYNGKNWTMDDILADEAMDYKAYLELSKAYYEGFNREAGSIFVDLVSLRNQIASKLGYGSYAAYRYDVYGRDYTVVDAQALHAAVKKYLVPIYLTLYEDDGAANLYDVSFEQAPFLSALSAACADFSPAISEAARYMLRNQLYDFSVNPKKMSGSFTTYINSYRTPYLFSQWTGSYSDITTVIHELGHFSNYYHNPSAGWSAKDSLDLAEIDSQGLELLMTPYFDQFYGEYAPSARNELLTSSLYAIISGCLEDEFQQLVYQTPTMSLEELNSLYLRLCTEYGFVEVHGFEGTEWTLIPHTFQTPMYYISYAVSMIAALNLYQMQAAGNVTKAKQVYLDILNREPFASFREVLRRNGLNDVFSESTIKNLQEVYNKK